MIDPLKKPTLAKLLVADTADLTAVILPNEYLNGLRDMFANVLTFFKDNHIHYWVDGGTLLGVVRDGGQIPYDDDVDLGMDTKNYFKLLKLVKQFKELYGYEVIVQRDSVIKIVDNNVLYVRNLIDGEHTLPRPACIDIFLYVEKKGEYMLDSPANRKLFPNCIYKKECLFPLVEYKYGDLIVTGANKPEQYLDSYYGNWSEKIIHLYY
jgi:phosphorylcholine metabolism protein LicD